MPKQNSVDVGNGWAQVVGNKAGRRTPQAGDNAGRGDRPPRSQGQSQSLDSRLAQVEKLLAALAPPAGKQSRSPSKGSRLSYPEWTCPACSREGNPGHHLRCHGCPFRREAPWKVRPASAAVPSPTPAPAVVAAPPSQPPSSQTPAPTPSQQTQPTPLESRLANAKSVLAAMKGLSPEDGRDGLVEHWENQVESIKLEMARARPLHHQLQSAMSRVEKTQEVLSAAQKAHQSAREALAAAQAAEVEATEALAKATSDLDRCRASLALAPEPGPGAVSEREEAAGLLSSFHSSLVSSSVALPPEARQALAHLASLLGAAPSEDVAMHGAEGTGGGSQQNFLLGTQAQHPAPGVAPTALDPSATPTGDGLAAQSQLERDASRSPRRIAAAAAAAAATQEGFEQGL